MKSLERIIWYTTYCIDILLLARFALKYVGVNPNSAYSLFVYITTEPFTMELLQLNNTPSTSSFVSIEWHTLIASVVYIITAFATINVLGIVYTYSSKKSLRSRKVFPNTYPQPAPQYTPTSYPQIAHN